MVISKRLNPQKRTINSLSIPAPVGGWNALDSLANMPPEDAVILDNFFPLASEVVLRDGSMDYATDITETVNTLAAYNSPTVNKLFAAAADSIYDVTSGGSITVADVTGLTNDQWQDINFSNAGGSFLYMANGSDPMYLYNGSTWAAITAAITGISTSSIIQLNVFKRRIWMVERDSLNIWYLPVDSITGAANKLDFTSLFKLGGYLMAMGTWSLDAGEGLDDYAVFVSSQGEVAVYKGTDPSSSTTWALTGIFTVGSPIGRRCFVKYAGDLLMISRDGLIPMSKALMSSRVNQQIALTNKIQQKTSEVTTNYANNFGWQTIIYPAENMLLLNVPISNVESQQFVMNTITGAWARFLGWNATCWVRFNDLIYFGTSNKVVHAWDGDSDNNTNIDSEALQSFNYFGNRSQIKRWNLAKPIISTNGNPSITIGINVDFDLSAPLSNPIFTPSAFAIWDVSLWDEGLWGGDYEIKKDWIGVNGIGKCAGLHMKTSSQGLKLKWAATDYNYEIGGFL